MGPVFTFDERIRGLPAGKDQVASLYQSINSPHLAIPGKQAGLSQAFIAGLRGQSGYGVFVYLYLADGPDCAVYASDRRNLSATEFEGEENEALGFVESMGFIMDNINFRALSPSDQDSLMRTLPLFRRDPKAVPSGSQSTVRGPSSGPGTGGTPTASQTLARLFASF